jgi:hypothetical protein
LDEINLGSEGLYDFFDFYTSEFVGIYSTEQTFGLYFEDMGTLRGMSPVK